MKLKIVSDPELIVADDRIKRTLFESRESCVSNKREIGLRFQVTEEALMGCVPETQKGPPRNTCGHDFARSGDGVCS